MASGSDARQSPAPSAEAHAQVSRVSSPSGPGARNYGPIPTTLQTTSFDPKRATPDSRSVQPSYVARATVLTGHHGSQWYLCATDFGSVEAFYAGASRSRVGPHESGGFTPGQQVWLVVSPSLPGLNASIIAAADHPVSGLPTIPQSYGVYPQVSGFEIASAYGGAPAEGVGFGGKAYTSNPLLRTYRGGAADTGDNQWAMTAASGAGVGVDMFSAWLRGGAFSGIFAQADTDLLRVVAEVLEHHTAAFESDARLTGPAVQTVERRSAYPMDVVYNHAPIEQIIRGQAHGGEHRFLSYHISATANESASSEDGAAGDRFSLLHEYRGFDGTYTLTAANAITLQKFVGLRVPKELVNASRESVPANEFPGVVSQPDGRQYAPLEKPSGDTPARRIMSPNTVLGIVSAMRLLQKSAAGSTSNVGLIAPALARYLVEVQGFAAFEANEQWEAGNLPTAKLANVGARSLFGASWSGLPGAIDIAIEPYGSAKRYYLGRAMMQITPEGGIVLQDAYGSQIIMSGGNIYFSAPHDVIALAGRNTIHMAGNDATIRAARHVDAVSNEGRMTLAAAGQMTIVGGTDGNGGVLIESLGSSENIAGDAPVSGSGVLIRAEREVALVSKNVRLIGTTLPWSASSESTGTVSIDAGSNILWAADNGRSFGYFGTEVMFSVAQSDFVFGETSTFRTSLRLDGPLFYSNMRFMRDTSLYTKLYLDNRRNFFLTEYANAGSTNKAAFNGTFIPRFATADELVHIGTSTPYWPEPLWHTAAEEYYFDEAYEDGYSNPAEDSLLRVVARAKWADMQLFGTVSVDGSPTSITPRSP